jgi:FkbM family methyltransferase
MPQPRYGPSQISRMLGIWKRTGSLQFALDLLNKGYTKPVLRYLNNGGTFVFENGHRVAKFGHQTLLIDRFTEKQFHILEHLDPIEFSGWQISFPSPDVVKIEYEDRAMVFDSYEGILHMLEFFSEYECLDVKGRTVIDIGAYQGESPLYFLLRGATKVLAIEPNISHYRSAVTTIKRNGFSGSIDLRNAGLGHTIHPFDSRIGDEESGPLWSMADFRTWIADHISGDSGFVMKIDCEGCEYALYNDPESVVEWRKLGLQEFVMEYHLGDVSALVEKWRSHGFHVYRVARKAHDCGILHGTLRS